MKTIQHLKEVTLNGYPFVSHVEQKEVSSTFNLLSIFDAKGYHGSQYDAMRHGHIKLMGYLYDIKELVNRYIIKTEHGGIVEYYAPNKTMVRKLVNSLYMGKIYWIKESS